MLLALLQREGFKLGGMGPYWLALGVGFPG